MSQKKEKQRKIRLAALGVTLLTFYFPAIVFAGNIVLKSGKEIHGKILEQNKDYVKVEVCEIPITFFIKEIRTIDGQTPSSVMPQDVSQESLSNENETGTHQTAAESMPEPECIGSSNVVTIKNRQLWIRKRLPNGVSEQPKIFVIKGVSWSPATTAPDTGPNPFNPFNPSENVPYGFFFDWEGRNPQGHDVFLYWLRTEFAEHYKQDIPLLKDMNVNTVRVYTDFGLDVNIYKKILDEFFKNDIMVIATVASSKAEIQNGRYLDVVREYKNHPVVLVWSLGNEWNLDYNKFWGYMSVAEAAEAVNKAAGEIKKIDSNHPVCSILGDRFTDLDPANTIEETVRMCPNVDLWGINVYRGESFGNLFEEWRQISSKPLFISEFGTDSFRTSSYEITPDGKASHCQGQEDEEMQARVMRSLYHELKSHLSASNENECCVGGLVHEFNDELWKVGSYHALLGGLVNYDDPWQKRCYMRYDAEGAYLKGGHPDDVANEEYFGVVSAHRKPKKAYYEIQRLYGN